MSDKWICIDCDYVNDKHSSDCYRCHSSKFWKGVESIEIVAAHERIYVKKPSIWMRDEVAFRSDSGLRLTKCPKCVKIMFHGDRGCPHCQHILSEVEMEKQTVINRFGLSYYMKSIVIWGLILYGISYVASQFNI